MSGKKIADSVLSDEIIKSTGTTDFTAAAYMVANDITSIPKCIKCETEDVPFVSVIRGFKKYCPHCGKKIVRERFVNDGPMHSKRRSEFIRESRAEKLEDAIRYYTENDTTIMETAKHFAVKKGALRSALIEKNLIMKNNSRRVASENFKKRVDDRLLDPIFLASANAKGLTLKEVADDLGVATNTVRLYALRHDIVFQNFGRAEREILEFIREFDQSAMKKI